MFEGFLTLRFAAVFRVGFQCVVLSKCRYLRIVVVLHFRGGANIGCVQYELVDTGHRCRSLQRREQIMEQMRGDISNCCVCRWDGQNAAVA